MRFLFCFLLIFPSLSMADSLQMPQSDSIKAGERVPNVLFFERMSNLEFVSSINRYKGSLLILDFWSRGCGSCIASFPDLERLNNLYKGKAIILPVTKDSYQALHDLREKSQIMRESKMVQVLQDSILHALFPHRFVPHYVWIDKEGKFVGTSGKVDSGAVSKVLLTGSLPAIMSNSKHVDDPIVYGDLDSVALNVQRNKSGRSYYSSFQSIVKHDFNRSASKMYPIWADSTKKKVVGFRYYGYYLIDLIKFAYGITYNGDIGLSDDSLKYLFPPKEKAELEEWQADKIYAYTFWSDSMSAFDSNSKKLIMRKDLQERFGIIGFFKEFEKSCYVLSEKRKEGALSYYQRNEGVPYEGLGRSEITLNGIYAKNVKVSVFLRSLYHFVNRFNRFELPIINDTNYNSDDLVNMYIKVKDFRDLASVDEALSNVELSIKKAVRRSVFFVISKEKE